MKLPTIISTIWDCTWFSGPEWPWIMGKVFWLRWGSAWLPPGATGSKLYFKPYSWTVHFLSSQVLPHSALTAVSLRCTEGSQEWLTLWTCLVLRMCRWAAHGNVRILVNAHLLLKSNSWMAPANLASPMMLDRHSLKSLNYFYQLNFHGRLTEKDISFTLALPLVF